MRTFCDAAGNEWRLELTLGRLERLKGESGVDLLRLNEGEPPLLLVLHSDPVKLVEIVYALGESAAKAQLSLAGYKDAVDGRTLAAMSEAFWGEIDDFFRPWWPAMATLIREVLTPTPTPETPGASSGDSPDSSAAIPAP